MPRTLSSPRGDRAGRLAKRKKGRGEVSHVRLYRWLMRSEAWCDLDCFARCGYVELARRYGGEESETPNGKIPCSVREMAKALNVSVATASRAFAQLQDHGFIVLTKRGAFSLKQRHATEWRLTEFPSRGQLPTK